MPLLAFAIAVAYVPGLVAHASAGRWAVMALAVPLLWRSRLSASFGVALGAALVLWCAASVLWSVNINDTVGELLHVGLMAAVFMAAFQEQTNIERCFAWLAVGVAISVPVAFAQVLGLPLPIEVGILPAHGIGRTAIPTGVGLFLSKEAAAEMGALAFVGALSCGRWRLALIGPGLLLLMTGSGVGMVAVLLTSWVCVFASLPIVSRDKRVFQAAAMSMIICALLGMVIYSHSGTLEARAAIWMETVRNIVLPFGWGLGTYGTLLPVNETAHNELLQLAFEIGFGVLLLVALMVHALRKTVHDAAWPVLVCAIFLSMGWSILGSPGAAFVVALVAGHLCGIRSRASREISARERLLASGVLGNRKDGAGALYRPCGVREMVSIRPQYQVGC